ncbi:MAG: hypothetical protein JXR48_01195 [Candidatus Delongbacteria bacterium]|nr:hypothetical protein [Candidatus Delongbacteria bacterium]MBN2833559.1 hypothetical protein [Candidatus Delongbacteria bacterium]
MKFILLILLTVSITLSAQGIMKTFSDPVSKQNFNNFKSDSTEVVFIVIKIDKWLLYSNASNSSDVIATLGKGTFCEYYGSEDQYYKIRVYEEKNGYIEGFAKKNGFETNKYYGKSFTLKNDSSIGNFDVVMWVLEDTPVYSDSLLTNRFTDFEKGQKIYMIERLGEIYKITKGASEAAVYVSGKSVGPFITGKGYSTDFENLPNQISTSLLKYDIDTEAFLSYRVLQTKNNYPVQFTEDKRCHIESDSILYRYSYDNNDQEIFKRLEIKGVTDHKFSMYKQIDNKTIITPGDTLDCFGIEVFYKPKAGKVIIDNIETNEIYNKSSKLYIYNNPVDNINLVVEREDFEYIWKYKYLLNEKKFENSDASVVNSIKRLITYRKK